MFPWILGAAILLIIIWILGSYLAMRTVETPEYDVLETRNGYELREYSDYIVAQVKVYGEREEAINSGFRLLAGYIFGGNKQNTSISMIAPVNNVEEKSVNISMTAPVNNIKTDSNTHLVQFILPSKYTLKTVPTPNDSRIQIKKVDGYTAAVIKYTLWATDDTIKRNKAKLIKHLERDKLEISGKVISAQYNPPLSFPHMRRNEVIAEIK